MEHILSLPNSNEKLSSISERISKKCNEFQIYELEQLTGEEILMYSQLKELKEGKENNLADKQYQMIDNVLEMRFDEEKLGTPFILLIKNFCEYLQMIHLKFEKSKLQNIIVTERIIFVIVSSEMLLDLGDKSRIMPIFEGYLKNLSIQINLPVKYIFAKDFLTLGTSKTIYEERKIKKKFIFDMIPKRQKTLGNEKKENPDTEDDDDKMEDFSDNVLGKSSSDDELISDTQDISE